MPLLTIFRTALLRSGTSFRLIAALYVINLVFAGIIALGFRSAIASSGGVAALAPLMDGFDFTIVSDYMHTRGDGVRAVMQTALIMMAVSSVGNSVMAGGVLTLLRDGNSFSLRAFFAGCGAYALRFIRLMLATGAVTIVTLAAVLGLAGSVAGTVDATSENVPIAWMAGGLIASAALLLLMLMAGDYARVMIVHTDARSSLRTLLASSRFVVRNFFAATGLQLLMTAVAGACIVLYLCLEPALPATSGGAILVLFFMQQFFVAARIWARVAIYTGELGFYDSRRPAGPESAW